VTAAEDAVPGRFRARPFAALAGRNYRLFFVGQIVSLSGTTMQVLGQAWLVLTLTGNGLALGAITAAQFLPMLIGSPYAGVWTDRLD
jgi:hypothetical protein